MSKNDKKIVNLLLTNILNYLFVFQVVLHKQLKPIGAKFAFYSNRMEHLCCPKSQKRFRDFSPFKSTLK